MKLVVVEPRAAAEMVPHDLPVRQQPEPGQRGRLLLQQPVPRPARGAVAAAPGPRRSRASTIQTKWFYERTRGQYQNEKNKLTPAQAKHSRPSTRAAR